jgi:ketosteroid isomerase-like protein
MLSGFGWEPLVKRTEEDSMDTRATIESILDQAYAARQRQDVMGAAACFTEDGCFKINGGPPTTCRAEQHSALRQQFDAFELLDLTMHCRLIDPPRAAVHWRGKFKAKNGQVTDTDILDLVEVREGRISSLTTFFDTALAASLAGGR